MTVIRPNSVSGITSITAQANEINFFRSNGALAGLQLNGVNFNTTTGVSTFNNLNVGGVLTYQDVTNVDSVGIITARSTIDAQGDVSIADKIIHTGNTNTAIRFPTPNTITAETAGTERLRIDSSGRIGVGVVPTAQFAHNLIQIGHQATLGANAALSATGQTFLTHNLYFDTGGTFRVFNTSNANEGAIFRLVDGQLLFSNSAATTGTPTVTERLRITSGGTVNIGGDYTSTTSRLRINSTSYPETTEYLAVFKAGVANGNRFKNRYIKIRNNYTGSIHGGVPIVWEANADGSNNKAYGAVVTEGNGDIRFLNGAATTEKAIGTDLLSTISEKLRLDSSGRLLLGTTSRGQDDADNLTIDGSGEGTGRTGITIRSASNTFGSIFFSDATTTSAQYDGVVAYDHSTQMMRFSTASTQRVFINSSGQLLVGTSSPTSLGSHTGASNVSTFNQSGITLTQYGVTAGFYYDRLNFTNSQYFIVNASNTGVYLGNGATSWTGYSDERMKTNITELDGTKAYNHVKTSRAASFKWNATGYPTDMKIGFIAQDWETNYPEVVNSTTETIDSVENPKGIQYTETVPVLMAALKQAISKIETLEAKVAALEGS